MLHLFVLKSSFAQLVGDIVLGAPCISEQGPQVCLAMWSRLSFLNGMDGRVGFVLIGYGSVVERIHFQECGFVLI